MRKLVSFFFITLMTLPSAAAGQPFQYGEINPPQPVESKDKMR
jgi:hypothetical protein